MRWLLVVLVGGVAPVSTNLVFDKFSDCLAAEEQMRQHYADAFDAWDRTAAVNTERRHEYRRARDAECKKKGIDKVPLLPKGQTPGAKDGENGENAKNATKQIIAGLTSKLGEPYKFLGL
jgi:hypothetical protein